MSKKRSNKRSPKKNNKKQTNKLENSNSLIDDLTIKIENARKIVKEKGLEEPIKFKNVSSRKIAKGLNDTNKIVSVIYMFIIQIKLKDEDAKKLLLQLKAPSGKKLIGGRSISNREEIANRLYYQFKNLNWENLINSNIVKHYKIKQNKDIQKGGFLSRLENCYPFIRDMLDSTQTVLDTLGTIPPAGFLFDLMSVSMNTLRNRPDDALFSLISMVPIAGDIVGKGLKFLKNKPEVAQALMSSYQLQTLESLQSAKNQQNFNMNNQVAM